MRSITLYLLVNLYFVYIYVNPVVAMKFNLISSLFYMLKRCLLQVNAKLTGCLLCAPGYMFGLVCTCFFFSVPDEGYSRNASSTLNLMSMFLWITYPSLTSSVGLKLLIAIFNYSPKLNDDHSQLQLIVPSVFNNVYLMVVGTD
jgi:hypothetical protein